MKQDSERNRKRLYVRLGVLAVIGIYALLSSFLSRTFDVTVNGRQKGSYRWREKVTMDVYVPEGKVFTGWTVEEGDITLEDASSETISFVMPAREVKLIANFEIAEYSVEVENGSGAGSYTMDETVEISADAAPEGQVFVSWAVEDDDDDVEMEDAYAETTSFPMPAEDVKVTAEYIPIHDGQIRNAWIETCNAFAEKYSGLLNYSLEEAGDLLLESGLQIEGEDGKLQDEVYISEKQYEEYGPTYRIILSQSPGGSYAISVNEYYDADEHRYIYWNFWYYPGHGSDVISGPLQEMLSFMSAPDPWEALGISQEMLDWAEKNIEDSHYHYKEMDSEWYIFKFFEETDKSLMFVKDGFDVGPGVSEEGVYLSAINTNIYESWINRGY